MSRLTWAFGLIFACGQLGFENVGVDGGVRDANGVDVGMDAAPPQDVAIPDASRPDASLPCVDGTTRVVGDCGDGGATTETCEAGVWGDGVCVEMPVATHEGWVDVMSVGRLNSAATPSQLSPRDARLTIRWVPPSVTPDVDVEGYRVLRATSAAGPFVVVDERASDATPVFVDTSERTAATYYYVVRPVVDGVALSTNQADSVLAVPTPPDNMALVHRWIANQEMCARLDSPVDPARDYRCAYSGPGRLNYSGDIGAPPPADSFYDIGAHVFVDTVEAGCAYTLNSIGCPDALDTPGPCLGTGSAAPTDISNEKGGQSQVGVEGDVFYDRGSSQCWYRNAAGWVATGSANDAELASMSSFVAGLPPLVRVTQVQSNTLCEGRGERSLLLSRRTQVAAASWGSSDDMSISDLESGEILASCNSDGGHPGEVTFDALVFPDDASSLPTTAASGVRTLRTGDSASARCTSRYGAQDLVGNVWEWTSDQCMSGAGTCVGVTSTLASSANAHIRDIPLAEALGGGGDSFAFDDVPRWLPVVGLPAPDDAPAWQEALVVDPAQLHSDGIFLFANSSALRGMYIGGSSTSGAGAGRYAFNVSEAPQHVHPRIGFRCMQVVP